MDKSIYVVFSNTPCRIGKLIRSLTGEQYNHVSIALDRDLSRMYSFARRYYRTPLYGGFVKESLSRYHADCKPALCMICAVPVSIAQYTALEAHLDEMHSHKEQYLYNYLSALTFLFRKRVHVRDARLCVEFVSDTLSQLDTPVDNNKFYTTKDLCTLFERLAVYTGPMPAPAEYDEVFFAKKPVPHPHLTSIRHMIALLPRLRKKGSVAK